MADLLKQLKKEHRQAETLMDKLEEAEQPKEREPLLSELEAVLAAHMETEEQIVYPVLATIDSETAEEAEVEHNGARELLTKLRSGGVEQPGFGALVAALRGAITHHVDEEENEIFPMLRKEAGADAFSQPGPAVTSGPADASSLTKEELYERAKEMDIEGRSGMSKDELAQAVQSGSAPR